MADKQTAAFVDAVHTPTGKIRTVPAHYLNNPDLYGGAFTLPDTAGTAAKSNPKKSSRRSSAGSVETPATAVEATETNPPQAGETDSEE